MAALSNSSSLLFSIPSKTAINARTTSISSSQSRPKRRKNSLRTKILKTLNKPQSSPPLVHQQSVERFENPENLAQETLENVHEEELIVSSNGDSDRFFGEFQAMEECVEKKGLVGADKAITARSVVELVLYFVGLFVVQTVCTVAFVMFSNESGGEGEVGLVGERKKEGFWDVGEGLGRVLGGGLGRDGVDGGRVREKIEEIRAMARAARESEAKSLSGNGGVSLGDGIDRSGNGGVSKEKTNVEIEVDRRLSKVEKKLESMAKESASMTVSYAVNAGDGKGSEREGGNAKDEKIVFKKKLKFKSPSAALSNKVKGFGNVNDGSKVNGKGNRKLKRNGGSNENSHANVTIKEEEPNHLVEDGVKGPLNGSSNEGRSDKHVVGGLSPSQDLETKADEEGKRLVKGIGTINGNSEPKYNAEPKNSQGLEKEDKSEQEANKVREERLGAANDLWWKNLPYALAILLRNGSDSEGPSGLYSLKMNEGSLSYTVAFEDQNDATNFCYILETFFEDLGDIRADVVPLSRKEMNDAVTSHAMKIMVVRKGQLKLYAGQPLTDIETTLRSLMK